LSAAGKLREDLSELTPVQFECILAHWPLWGAPISCRWLRRGGESWVVQTVQAVGGLIGTLMTIYGRVRATKPLAQRSMQVKL
jgi:hypothetical protein